MTTASSQQYSGLCLSQSQPLSLSSKSSRVWGLRTRIIWTRGADVSLRCWIRTLSFLKSSRQSSGMLATMSWRLLLNSWKRSRKWRQSRGQLSFRWLGRTNSWRKSKGDSPESFSLRFLSSSSQSCYWRAERTISTSSSTSWLSSRKSISGRSDHSSRELLGDDPSP